MNLTGSNEGAEREHEMPSDEELRRCKSGDPDAFADLVQEYYQSVYQMCWYLMNSDLNAADATQETFLRAFQAIRKFRGNASIRTWLFSICIRVCSDIRRQAERHQRHPLTSTVGLEWICGSAAGSAQNPRVSACREEMRRKVREAVCQLPESHRRVVVLVAFEELSHEEAGRLLGLRTATVTWYMKEARKRLRAILDRDLLENVQSRQEANESDGQGK